MIERIEEMPEGFGHHSAWKRFALVTDVEWVARAMHMFAWMTPGDVMIRGLDGLDEAKAWVASARPGPPRSASPGGGPGSTR